MKFLERIDMVGTYFEHLYKTNDNQTPSGNVPYIWTGGRKCNFAGCDRADLQPAIENGWFWAPRGRKIAPPSTCGVCDWSFTGG